MTGVTLRILGVEEEFLLVDAVTGRPAPVARAVVADSGGSAARLAPAQVATVAPGLRDLTDLRCALADLRCGAGGAAERRGVALVASGTSPVGGPGQLTCGCHVHVQVASPEEGAGAVDRMRPWLPALVAVAANSPFWRGSDTGYASYRTLVRGRRPPAVTSVASSSVTVQVADAALDVDGAVLVAALARALVDTAAREWRQGRPSPAVRPELARLATWRASRSGLSGVLVDVATRRPVPARVLVARLVRHLGDSLDEAGDHATVEELTATLLAGGTGAARQREAYRREGRLEDVVSMLKASTVPGPAAALA
jgi:carboxylate-amine ligase